MKLISSHFSVSWLKMCAPLSRYETICSSHWNWIATCLEPLSLQNCKLCKLSLHMRQYPQAFCCSNSNLTIRKSHGPLPSYPQMAISYVTLIYCLNQEAVIGVILLNRHHSVAVNILLICINIITNKLHSYIRI